MKRAKKIAWVLLGTAVLLVVVYFAIPESPLTGDELKFAQMRH